MKKKLWRILLVIGTLPFVIAIYGGMKALIHGFSGLQFCFTSCTKQYGFKAFIDSILLFSYFCWPVYIVGVGCIALATFKLRK